MVQQAQDRDSDQQDHGFDHIAIPSGWVFSCNSPTAEELVFPSFSFPKFGSAGKPFLYQPLCFLLFLKGIHQ